MYRNSGAAEARISALMDHAQRQLGQGQQADAIATQREAAREARELVARIPDDPRLRQGLASLLYNFGSMLINAGEPAAAVPELDDSHDQYASLIGIVADAELLCADVRARRGLAQAFRGRAASAIADADAAVRTYAEATGTDSDHPRRPDLARVLALNAVVQARHGDPDLAAESADAALEYYVYQVYRSGDARIPAEYGGYLLSASVVSALFNLATGEFGQAYAAARIIAGNLEPGNAQRALESRLAHFADLLDAEPPPPIPAAVVHDLAESLTGAMRGRVLLWVPSAGQPDRWQPPGTGQPPRDLPPTLAAALSRHATGTGDQALAVSLTAGQRGEPQWTPSLRWPPGLPLTVVLRLAELAIETLPSDYADGLRLALNAHVLLATAHAPQRAADAPASGDYIPLWRRLLAATAAACRTAGDSALAEDLTGLEASLAG
jgi:hypothetical protein